MQNEQLPPAESKGIYVKYPLQIGPLPLSDLVLAAKEKLAPLMVPATPMLEGMYKQGYRDAEKRIFNELFKIANNEQG